MQRLILVTTGMVIIAVGIWLVAAEGSAAPPDLLSLPLAEAAERVNAPAAEIGDGEPGRIDTTPLPPEVSDAQRGPGSVAGRLLDVEGSPAGQARVSLRFLHQGKRVRHRPPSMELVTHTNAEGRFNFQGLALGTWQLDADDGRRSIAEPRRVVLEADEASLALDIQLVAGHPLSGSIRSGSGAPLAGLLVTLRAMSGKGGWRDPIGERRSISDETGRFALEGLRHGADYELGAVHPDLFLREGGGAFQVRGETRVDLVMGSYATLAGRLEDAEGGAVAGAEVELEGRFAAKSDDTGAFVIAGIVPADVPMELLAATPDRDLIGRTMVTLREGELHEGLVFSLQRSARVSGRVTDVSGRGIAGATVSASGAGGSPSPSELVISGSHVAVEDALRAAIVQALVTRQVEALVAAQRQEVSVSGRLLERSISEVAGAPLVGDVNLKLSVNHADFAALAANRPSEDAWRSGRVTLVHSESPLRERLQSHYRWVRTDAEGFYEILGLVPEVPYALNVAADGFLASEATPMSFGEWGEEEKVDRVLHRGAVLRGATGSTFVDPSSKETFEIQLIDRASGKLRSFKLPAAESYELSGVLPGRYRLRARTGVSRGLVALLPDLILEADRIYESVNLHFEPGACVSGRVSDPHGRPLAGATLVIQGGDVTSRSVHTDAAGSYRLGGLFPGTYRLELRARGFPKVESITVNLLEGQEVVHDFAPQQGIAVRGLTKGPDGQSLGGVHVFLHGTNRVYTTSDDEGRFRIADVPPATYFLFARSDDRRLNMARELVLQPGAGEEIELSLTVRPCLSLRGRIEDSSGRTPRGKVVAVFAGDPRVRRDGEISGDGTFVIPHLYAGSYQVSVLGREGADPTHATVRRGSRPPFVVLSLRN